MTSRDAHGGNALAEALEVSRACARLANGPFTPARRRHGFDGSEDFALDGRGGMVSKRGNDLVRVDASGQTTCTLAALPGQTLGLRCMGPILREDSRWLARANSPARMERRLDRLAELRRLPPGGPARMLDPLRRELGVPTVM